jgi:hypothetical protein
MHACIYTYIRTYKHTYIRTYIHAYIQTYIHSCIYTYMHAYIHTYIHTYIHAYVIAYVTHQVCVCVCVCVYVCWRARPCAGYWCALMWRPASVLSICLAERSNRKSWYVLYGGIPVSDFSDMKPATVTSVLWLCSFPQANTGRTPPVMLRQHLPYL